MPIGITPRERIVTSRTVNRLPFGDGLTPPKPTYFDQETRSRLIDYSMEVETLATPDEVLNRLHDITSEKNPIRVLGANRFSIKVGDWRRIELGKNVFVHSDAPPGWLEEWSAFVASGHPMGLMTARMCLAPFTWTELSRMLEPIGIDRWPFELAMKYRMRDGYLCPVGGRWVVTFWSTGVLGNSFTQQARGLLYMAASATAVRLERLVGDDVKRVGSRACLTPREQAVVRHASIGMTMQETANALGLGEETVRSHFKKAQAKLGTRNRTHTVAEAMRDLLII
jgi:LuxR family quorum sensing-dependent transcriptional regulator